MRRLAGLPATVGALFPTVEHSSARLGMRVTGHIPALVHLSGALQARQDLEHTDKLVFDVWRHDFDATRTDSVAQAIRGAGVQFNPWTDFQMRVIAGLRRAKMPLVAGTDYPNAMLAPGSGVIEELRALHAIGLSAYEALAAATVNAAAALDDSTSGFIGRGARADARTCRGLTGA